MTTGGPTSPEGLTPRASAEIPVDLLVRFCAGATVAAISRPESRIVHDVCSRWHGGCHLDSADCRSSRVGLEKTSRASRPVVSVVLHGRLRVLVASPPLTAAVGPHRLNWT